MFAERFQLMQYSDIFCEFQVFAKEFQIPVENLPELRNTLGMGEVFVGTSGFSYEDWRKAFYPEELPKEDFLRFYSLYFQFVELDYTYYRMPQAAGLRKLAEHTREGFRFAVKAHRSLTHEANQDWRGNALDFSRALDPLAAENRLAGCLLQFPYRFKYTSENRIYLRDLVEALGPFPLFLEFRNSEWLTDAVFEEMKRRNLGYVMVDEPELKGLPDRRLKVTAELSYLRFHGRNADNWWNGDNVSRYDYLYSDEELAEWLPRIAKARKSTSILYIAFNNHYGGQAVKNARSLITLIADSDASAS
jgi:uncharacterized protein YecE (DUF72 family)